MRTIKGTIDKFIFRNDESGYAVARLTLTGGGTMIITGNLASVSENTTVVCSGEDVMTKYGQQFKVGEWEESRPNDIEGIEKYLSSGLIKNIGPVLAHEIVSVFGEDTLEVLDNEPYRLAEIHGIGKKRIESITESVKEQKAIRSIMIWLKRYNLTNGLSAKIYKKYGNNAIHTLEGNPYILADELDGVGFKKADDVAMKLGIEPQSHFRIRSGLLHCVKDFTDKGSTYMPRTLLLETAAGPDYLSLPEELLKAELDAWVTGEGRKVLVEEDGCVYPSFLHWAERTVSKRLKELCCTSGSLFGGYDENTEDDETVRETGIIYNARQSEAIDHAENGGVLVLTGGPGTGKTVTTNGIINRLRSSGKQVLLCAPTGRAARRMTEVTGHKASTIHRLLGYNGEGFSHNEDNPLPGDAIIVDESSMIDIGLMASLLLAVPDGMTVVLVGDVDQLPSVGSGSVLRDIINSGAIPTVRLTTIYRQAQDSDIVMGAHAINKGFMPRLDNRKGTDLVYVEREEVHDISQMIIDLTTRIIPERTPYEAKDIQVLSPMRRDGDPLGITVLNGILQDILNPQDLKLTHNGREFRLGDKVMQIKNDYNKNVFNGDTGYIIWIDAVEEKLTVDFGDAPVEYTKAETSQLELAYASTVHKSQGSEYPVVVMPVHRSHYILLKRNLLYTAITRAKKMCVLVGTKKAIWMAINNIDTDSRFSGLTQRLNGQPLLSVKQRIV